MKLVRNIIIWVLFLPSICKAQTGWKEVVGGKTNVAATSSGVTINSLSTNRTQADQTPIPRYDPCVWADKKGGLWVFGGVGEDDNGLWGVFQDLWYFNSDTKGWSLVGGVANKSSQVDLTDDKMPTGRRDAATWVDKKGNFWLYGGRAVGDTYHTNDLWEFNIKNQSWLNHSRLTSINEKPKHASKPSMESTGSPGSRSGSITWSDNKGDLWLFGGIQNIEADGLPKCYNDIWRFDTSKEQWYNVTGNQDDNQANDTTKISKGQTVLPSGRYNSASWYDEKQKALWIYGGNGYGLSTNQFGTLSDMWAYDMSKNSWVPMGKEFKIDADYNIGSAETPSKNANPGKRVKPTKWIDAEGNFYLMGGHNSFSDNVRFSDEYVWKYTKKLNMWSIEPNVMSAGIGQGETFQNAKGEWYMFGGIEYKKEEGLSECINKVFKLDL